MNSLKGSIDVDDVLAELVKGLCLYLRDKEPNLCLANGINPEILYQENFREYQLSEWTGCTRESERILLSKYFESADFHNVPVVEGAVENIERISDYGIALDIITSRPDYLAETTKAFLERYFPNRFKEIHFASGQTVSNGTFGKGDICRKIGAKFHIEDSSRHALDCLEKGVIPIVLKQPWNLSLAYREGIFYAEDWSAIYSQITGLFPKL